MAAEEKQTKPTKADVEKNKVNAVLSYFGILIIIPLLSESAKKSAYAKFHMNQGLVLTLASFIASFVSWIPVIGWIPIIGIVVLWVMGLISAFSGDMKKVPLLGDIELIK